MSPRLRPDRYLAPAPPRSGRCWPAIWTVWKLSVAGSRTAVGDVRRFHGILRRHSVLWTGLVGQRQPGRPTGVPRRLSRDRLDAWLVSTSADAPPAPAHGARMPIRALC